MNIEMKINMAIEMKDVLYFIAMVLILLLRKRNSTGVAPRAGFEPAITALTERRLTTWLPW